MSERESGVWITCVPGGHLIGLDKERNAHAIPWALSPESGDFDAVCGASVRLYGVLGVSPTTGEETGVFTYEWPPRSALWKKLNGGDRCAECHKRTGSKRPASRFDAVFNIEPAYQTASQLAASREGL